jgi:hypothetical protein
MKKYFIIACLFLLGCFIPQPSNNSYNKIDSKIEKIKKEVEENSRLPTFLCKFRVITENGKIINSVENEYFKATILPAGQKEGSYLYKEECNCYLKNPYSAFLLRVENKTLKDLELDWNKTLFIENGKTNGGFMFEGIVYKDRNNPKPPDIIFGNSIFEKVIFPNNLVFFLSDMRPRWGHTPFHLGENGVYLTIKVDGREINQKLSVIFEAAKE